MNFKGLSPADAAAFAARWLSAWTGNDPERLVAFYTDDAFYSDPGIPRGVQGKAALLDYFRKLLARYPDWRWTQERAVPLEDGFLNFWKAEIPEKDRVVVLRGVCLVQMRGVDGMQLRDGLIRRNEVFFDRTPWLKQPG